MRTKDDPNFIQAAGGIDRLMKDLGVSRRTLFSWRATRIPAARVPDISRITGIPRHELRPDLWEAPRGGSAA